MLTVSKQKIGPKSKELNQLKTSFLVRELEGRNEEVKQPQREKVARFFADHRYLGKTRCFCLPGVRWGFENTLARYIREIEFVGVERNWTIIEHGIKRMPGYHLLLDEFQTRKNRFHGFSTDCAKIIWSEASRFLNTRNGDMSGSKQKKWMNLYRRWTCAWLDFSSPINAEVIACCKRLEHFLNPNAKAVPVAVTYMIGREEIGETNILRQLSEDDDKCRLRALFFQAMWMGNANWNSELIESWQYASAGGCPMGVATFLMTPKTGAFTKGHLNVLRPHVAPCAW